MGLSDISHYIQRSSKELHTRFMKDEFQYPPLRGHSDIRLLRVEPGRQSDQISCSVRVVSLDNNPKYTAISYTWRKQFSTLQAFTSTVLEIAQAGSQGIKPNFKTPMAERELRFKNTILCNGKKIDITPNLYDALLSFRQTRPSNCEYWIDAICINQRDIEEKTAQVQMMGGIYRSADFVLVWLGDCSSTLAKGLSGLEALARKPPSERPAFPISPHDSKEIHAVAGTALRLTNRIWFTRVWVLQEFLLAKEVIFLCGQHHVSLEALLTAFTWTYQNPSFMRMHTDKIWFDTMAYFVPLFMPHVHDIPNTLMSRQAINQGRRLTLREWLRACRGRQAEDLRDFVFGGLGLITPESLIIDKQRLQWGEHAPSKTPPPLPPRPGTLCDIRNQPAAGQRSAASLRAPKGLWSVLEADYTANENEVLVNVAACLLSQNEHHNLDLLSIAARPPEKSSMFNDFCIEFLGLEDLDSASNVANIALPSWVPALGSWNFVHSNLASAAEEAGGGGTAFAAGTLGQPPPSSRISLDGKTLYLDSARLGTVTGIIIEADDSLKYHTLLRLNSLIRFLRSLTGMTHAYLLSGATSFDAVASTLASSLLSFSSNGTATSFLIDREISQCSLLLPSEKHPRTWLCEFIDREVCYWVTYLRDALEKPINKTETEMEEKMKKQKKLDSLVDVYWQLVNKFSSLPWSRTAGQGGTALQNGGEKGEAPGNPNTLTGRFANMVINKLGDTPELQVSESDAARLKRRQSISPEAQQYENSFHYALCWQSLFSTSDGHIGMGPRWLSSGDTVMLIRGAIVPYIFRHVDDNLKLQADNIKMELEELEEELLAQKHSDDEEEQMDTRREIAKLRRELIQTEGQIRRKDAWILIGEAYVEGIMRGEVLERQGNDIWEKIAIV